MLGTLIAAVLLVVSSVATGRTLMLVLGWKRPEWVAGAVGFATLVVIAPFAVRLPGRGLTAAIVLATITVACVVVTRRATPRRGGSEDPTGEDDARPRAQHLVALCVVPIVIAAACLPFLFNQRTGVLGEGIYTNDQAAQLYWADWLQDGFGPQPNAVSFGYPVGPQALAASVSEGTGVNLVDAFNGLLVAIPALTALAALSLLGGLAPLRRGLAACLAGLPYLGASFLAQSGFKETVMAMLVVALAVVLHLALRREDEDRDAPPARSVVGILAVLAVASVLTFSVPGGVWFAIAIPVWAILTLGFGTMSLDLSRIRTAAAEHRALIFIGALALIAIAALALGPAGNFVDKIDEVQGSSGRLSSPVFPGEALGIWPEGDFRIVRGEVDGALIATGFAVLCVLGAAFALIRRREWAILSALGAAAFVYALARPFSEIHVEAKALCVMAPITMLVTVRWLLGPGRERGDLLRQAAGAAFCALALISSLLALRAAPVGFNDRGEDDLRTLARQIGGEPVVFLGVDRFAGYWLRGTLAESPGGYVPQDVDARPEKTWQQGLAMDFDTLSPSKLDNYDYAITTSAAYASTPPPSFTEVAREGDYVLWKRDGQTPSTGVLTEGGDPGESLDCPPQAGGEATTLTTPGIAEQGDWIPDAFFEAPGSASATLSVPAGEWAISLQYHSQAALTISVDGEDVAELPPSLEGFYLTGAGRGAFWPAGELTATGDEVEVEVEAADPSGLQDALGVKRSVWLGTVALSSEDEPAHAELSAACGDYVDHYSKP
jgi:hypothetical protein